MFIDWKKVWDDFDKWFHSKEKCDKCGHVESENGKIRKTKLKNLLKNI